MKSFALSGVGEALEEVGGHGGIGAFGEAEAFARADDGDGAVTAAAEEVVETDIEDHGDAAEGGESGDHLPVLELGEHGRGKSGVLAEVGQRDLLPEAQKPELPAEVVAGEEALNRFGAGFLFHTHIFITAKFSTQDIIENKKCFCVDENRDILGLTLRDNSMADHNASVMTGVPDEELISRAQQRDEAAFSELVRRNSNSSFRLALSILKDTQEAEDEVQNSFLSAWKSIDRFKGESRFSTWMTRIVTNQCLMRLRSLRRAKLVSLEQERSESEAPQTMQIADPAESVENRLGTSELNQVLRREIQRLPPLLRDVLMLRDLQSLPTNEVADRLGITPAAAKSRVLRARAELRVRLQRACVGV